MSVRVCILDYGSGNVRSLYNMLNSIVEDVTISNHPTDIQDATHLFLPGVGSYSSAMSKIHKSLPLKILEDEVILKGKPILGICVGFQILSQTGEEFGETKGLGWLSGIVKKLPSNNVLLPHIGWNNINIVQNSELFNFFDTEMYFYYLHSYAFTDCNPEQIMATTAYESVFPSIMRKENIFGVQFHPEKSQKPGRRLITNFLEINN